MKATRAIKRLAALATVSVWVWASVSAAQVLLQQQAARAAAEAPFWGPAALPSTAGTTTAPAATRASGKR